MLSLLVLVGCTPPPLAPPIGSADENDAARLELWPAETLNDVTSAAGVGDVNGDHRDDVLALGPHGVTLHLGASTGFVGPAVTDLPTGWTGPPRPLGDLDDDGHSDLGLPLADGLTIVRGGSPLTPTAWTLPGAAEAAVVDLDHDGRDDLVTASEGALSIWLGADVAAWTSPSALVERETFAKARSGGDVDGDGHADVLAQVDDALVVLSGADASLAELTRLPLAGRTFGSAGDLDGDGIDDLWLASTTTLSVRFGDDLPLVSGTTLGTYTNGWVLGPVAALGDTDEDGHDDLAVSYRFHGSSSSGDANGFALYDDTGQHQRVTVWHDLYHNPLPLAPVAAAGDVQGDGYGDLVYIRRSVGAYLFLGGLDADRDGVPYGVDCDDNVPSWGAPGPFYPDADGDGYGDGTLPTVACWPPEGEPVPYVVDGTDCDDTQATVGPPTTWYGDADADGFGDPEVPLATCDAAPPPGYVANTDDCDDANDAVFPDAIESCDRLDDDCDGEVDEDCEDVDDDCPSDSDDTADTAGPERCGCATQGTASGLALFVVGVVARARGRRSRRASSDR